MLPRGQLSRSMKGRWHLTREPFGLTASGHGAAVHTFTFAAIGTGQGPVVYGFAENGKILPADTGGIEDTGANKFAV
jgi:hypothetical protein